METSDFQHVLMAARQLPKPSQAQLVVTLLQEPGIEHSSTIAPLSGLSEAELRALADAVLAAGHAKRLKHLLRLNRERTLTPALQTELDALLAESDRVALVKAKAMYTLRLLTA